MNETSPAPAANLPPLRWQVLTVALMVAGYAGYYLCRSDFSVALPLLIADMGKRGIPANTATVRFGAIASLGVLAYAIGKFPSGWLADFFGGRRNFLFGMGGSVAFTILFALAGGLPLFTLAWIGNRLVQSLGWAGMVKISSKWFSYSAYGSVMAIVSLSFLFGDAASRQLMSVLIAHGLGWRGLFYVAGAILALLCVVNVILLKESPVVAGFAEPPANPASLFNAEAGTSRPESFRSLLATFARTPVFWLVCLLSLGVTLLRETFNLWTPTYFTQALGLSNADAAQKSALFPLFGGVSVLLAGFISDRLGARGRATIVLWGLLLTGGALLVLAYAHFGGVDRGTRMAHRARRFSDDRPLFLFCRRDVARLRRKTGQRNGIGIHRRHRLSRRRARGRQYGAHFRCVGMERSIRGARGRCVSLEHRGGILRVESTAPIV